MFLADPQGEYVGTPPASWPAELDLGLADLRTLPHHLEALRARSAYESVEINANLDRRGWADAMAPLAPAAALSAARAELAVRHDDVSSITLAWAMYHAKDEGWRKLADVAVARSCAEPRLKHHAAIMYQDVSLAQRALVAGAGLTAPERRELSAMVAALVPVP